ncbi:CotH kinase family protein [Neobacillus sp. SM06]|uniref:CotH kinase family protein n=1 Tax=Neobacillus sp. SM06 TaxID=3422492 RepID=UPI003D2BEA4A
MSIPQYYLYIHPMDLKELKSDIWIDEPVPASLKYGKKKVEIDLAYRGSHIRKFKKKSYHITFYKPKVFTGVHEIHLNAEYKDPSLIRNKLSLDFFADIGTLSPASQHVQLFINGHNEGVYLLLESVDEYFLKKRNLPNGSIFYAVDDDANFSLISPIEKTTKNQLDSGYERKVGQQNDSQKLANFVYKLNTATKAEFEHVIQKLLDIDKYLRWLAGVVCTQNYDGFVHNYALYQNNETGLFEIIPWDYDATWGRDIHGDVMEFDYVRAQGFNTLTARLLGVSSFRRQYGNILKAILEEQFTVDTMTAKVEKMHNLLRPFVAQDPYIQKNIEAFDQEPEFIYQFIRDRNLYLREKLVDFL